MATEITLQSKGNATTGLTSGCSAPSIPQPQPLVYAAGQTLLPPLSRRGVGPGLIVLTTEEGSLEAPENVKIKNGVPSPLIKWAEEGYAVVELQSTAANTEDMSLGAAIEQLEECAQCQPKDSVGLVCYDPALWSRLASVIKDSPKIVGAVCFSFIGSDTVSTKFPIPSIQHLAGKSNDKLERSAKVTAYDYPSVASHLFGTPFTSDFNHSAEAVAHTRSLTFLKKLMQTPIFDLEAIWEEHTYYEFENRSVEHTMSTMVQEPYVNHVPTITGGVGRMKLSSFYRDEFIFSNSDDTELELISRTVGIDRVIDEFIFKFTHNQEINWILPGVPPTNKYLQIPFTAVVNIRGDRLYHEHIAWDQATVLRQAGLLPEYLSFPYQIDGKTAAVGKKFEYRLPVSGVETADKMRDKNLVRSNEMFDYTVRETDA